MSEYRTLFVKMGLDMEASARQKTTAAPAANFELLAGGEDLLSLALFISMVNVVHCLIKLSQTCDIFICDLVQSIKVCQGELAKTFIEASNAYNTTKFPRYNDLVNLRCAEIPMEWRDLDEESGIYHLVFKFGKTTVWARCIDKQTKLKIFVIQKEYNSAQDNVE